MHRIGVLTHEVVHQNWQMASIQTPDAVEALLAQTRDHEIAGLQVFGVNSLKSFTPSPEGLVGQVVASVDHSDRTFTIRTRDFTIMCDLQRTGRVVWLDAAAPYATTAATVRPTIRLIFKDGTGIDLTEPAKTKRISVTLAEA